MLMTQSTTKFVSQSDDELVQLSQAGDHQAYAELISRYRLTCMKMALSILRDRSDAEDEVQNALWKAFEHIQQFNREAKFSTWLGRIVVNQCLMRLRQLRRSRLLYVEDVQVGEDNTSLELRDERETPEERLGKRELAAVLNKEIARIPPLLRKVFLLRDVEERPMDEVARALGISVAAAKSRLLRARAELRNRLERHQGSHGAATLLA